MVGKADFDTFVKDFKDKTGSYPIYSVFHMAQALSALDAAYKKAIEANGGQWPSKDQLAAAFEGLEFQAHGRPITIREDNQGIEAQLLGTTTSSDMPFKTLTDIMIFDGGPLTAPVGEESVEWVRGLTPAFVDEIEPTTFK
ncbi:type 1 periplasmic-binding domain-containing protein [Jiella pelagia]|uniref:Leucine-binding protein domain-containing protein n=1 Tax=Jiella pelagia TaxID=2986949 RepID=A0ABY7BZ88_9HYPH|nr:hypothetical protein [Jiella pelagia]WAP66890.1 hypothetical protein OH818_14570 [Jiella pelagia]